MKKTCGNCGFFKQDVGNHLVGNCRNVTSGQCKRVGKHSFACVDYTQTLCGLIGGKVVSEEDISNIVEILDKTKDVNDFLQQI